MATKPPAKHKITNALNRRQFTTSILQSNFESNTREHEKINLKLNVTFHSTKQKKNNNFSHEKQMKWANKNEVHKCNAFIYITHSNEFGHVCNGCADLICFFFNLTLICIFFSFGIMEKRN